MIKRIGIVCLGCWGLNVQAIPVVFTSSQYETSAVAIAGAQADANFDSSPPTALPLVTSATVVGTTDFASGNGVAADGLLSTLAEASSVTGMASAIGTAEFIGNFSGGGLFGIQFDFDTQDFTDAIAFSMGNLFLLLISNNVTMLNEVFPASGLFTRELFIPPGDHTLDLLLSSEASTTSGGNALNFASVTFQASVVPEPPAWLTMLVGLLVLLACSRHSRVNPGSRRR